MPPETDRGQVDALIDETSAVMAEKIRHRVDAIIAMKEILTPEQFTELRAKQAEMHHGRWKGHHDKTQ